MIDDQNQQVPIERMLFYLRYDTRKLMTLIYLLRFD